MKSLLTQVLLFAANANVDYRIFSYANKKFTNVIVRAFTKSNAMSKIRIRKLLWNF